MKPNWLRRWFGWFSCPVCHVKFRWKSKGIGYLITNVVVMLILAPILFIAIIVCIALLGGAMAILAEGLPIEIATVISFLFGFSLVFIFPVLFCVVLSGVSVLMRPLFRELRALDTPASITYWLARCPVCHQYPPPDAIDYGKTKVCLQCKPTYDQSLREGVAG